MSKLSQELIEEVEPLLDEVVLFVSGCLLWRNGWNVEPGVSAKQGVSKNMELFVAPGDVDFTEAVLTFDPVDHVLASSSTHHLGASDDKLHESIVDFDRIGIDFEDLVFLALLAARSPDIAIIAAIDIDDALVLLHQIVADRATSTLSCFVEFDVLVLLVVALVLIVAVVPLVLVVWVAAVVVPSVVGVVVVVVGVVLVILLLLTSVVVVLIIVVLASSFH